MISQEFDTLDFHMVDEMVMMFYVYGNKEIH